MGGPAKQVERDRQGKKNKSDKIYRIRRIL
jgi:hypothetical protein